MCICADYDETKPWIYLEMIKTKVHTYTYNRMQTLIEILCSDNWEIYIPLTLKARIKKGNGGTLGRFDITL